MGIVVEVVGVVDGEVAGEEAEELEVDVDGIEDSAMKQLSAWRI